MRRADGVRRAWFKALGRPGRVLIRDRQARVAVVLSAVIVSAFVGALWIPLWLLALGPILWGVPHIASDLLYLGIRTGYCSRARLWILAGVPLAMLSVGGDLQWGFAGAAAVALVARASLRRRLAGAAVVGVLALGFAALGPSADLVFGHVHNFSAVLLWWFWRPRRPPLHLVPVVLLVVGAIVLLSPIAPVPDGASVLAPELGWDYQISRLAGPRLVLLFCFSQSVHYAVWMHVLPDDDRRRSTPVTFRASVASLQREFGEAGFLVAVVLSLGIAIWAVADLAAANHGYFRMARFHGHFELIAAVLLVLERGYTVKHHVPANVRSAARAARGRRAVRPRRVPGRYQARVQGTSPGGLRRPECRVVGPPGAATRVCGDGSGVGAGVRGAHRASRALGRAGRPRRSLSRRGGRRDAARRAHARVGTHARGGTIPAPAGPGRQPDVSGGGAAQRDRRMRRRDLGRSRRPPSCLPRCGCGRARSPPRDRGGRNAACSALVGPPRLVHDPARRARTNHSRPCAPRRAGPASGGSSGRGPGDPGVARRCRPDALRGRGRDTSPPCSP